MEMLVAVSQHRNQCYSRSKPQISDGFGSAPSTGFKGINCRTFQSGTGILPSPPSIFPVYTSPSRSQPKSPHFHSEPPKRSSRSGPLPITRMTPPKGTTFSDELSYSELWAGPAYSNSPPPSSLPIPKFSLCQKHTISLELPALTLHPVAKSAPPSPSRESHTSDIELFLNTDSATLNLRRILHLDTTDE